MFSWQQQKKTVIRRKRRRKEKRKWEREKYISKISQGWI
jgi:hypothetical protein